MPSRAVLFRFRSRYPLAAAPEPVLSALTDPERWPLWWPQIRSVRRHDETSGTVLVRSRLPITMKLHLTEARVEHGTMRARLGGDLVGWVRYRVQPAAGERDCVVAYEQECRLGRAVPAVLVRAAAPALRYNHEAMMRSGMRGLEAYASSR